MFKTVSVSQFRAVLEADASPALRKQFDRFASFDNMIEFSAALHEGDLQVDSIVRLPAVCTVINGDLHVENALDFEERYEGGGLFMVLGDVRCRYFVGGYGVNAFIDGNLTAEEAIINGFEDSSLSVIGSLNTRLFVGADI